MCNILPIHIGLQDTAFANREQRWAPRCSPLYYYDVYSNVVLYIGLLDYDDRPQPTEDR